MKALPLPELIKALASPEKQSMADLMEICKQASAFIKNEQIIWKKGAEFAKLFADLPSVSVPEDKPSAARETLEATARTQEMLKPEAETEVEAAYTKGQFNIYITALRPVPAGGANRLEQLRTLREASGELNSAPRMTLQKANELIADLELGDRAILIRSTPSQDDAHEIIKDLARVGISAEVRS